MRFAEKLQRRHLRGQWFPPRTYSLLVGLVRNLPRGPWSSTLLFLTNSNCISVTRHEKTFDEYRAVLAEAATTKRRRLCGLNDRNLLSQSSGDQNFKIRCPSGQVPVNALLLKCG